MSDSYKLTYFNVRALGEPIRLIFAYAGVDYEDIRVTHEEWPNIKENYPWGQLPVLEVNGKVLAQSRAIYRYLGRKFDLIGGDDWENAKLDEIADGFADLGKEWALVHHEKDETKKEELKKAFVETLVPKYYGKMNADLGSSVGPYILGNKLTWADILLAQNFFTFEILVPGIIEPYQNLKELQQTVFGLPNIKEWIAKRPDSKI